MYKKLLPMAFICFFLFVHQAVAQGLTKIANNIYSYVGGQDASASNSFAANAGIVIGQDGVLVVDTLVSAKEGERFLADIRKVTDKPVRYVVNTHTHLDHAFGNCVFAKPGVDIISQSIDSETLGREGASVLANSAAFGLKPEEMAGTKIVVPNISFDKRLLLDLGDEVVELVHVQPSHTKGSIVVFIPAKRVLFAGDVLFTDFHPYMAEGDFPGWIQTINTLLAADIEKIVPGHGPLSGKKELREMKEYLLLFDQKAKELASMMQNPEDITAELIKILPHRSLGEWMVGYNVQARYLQKQAK